MKVIGRGVQLFFISLLGGVTQFASASPLEGVCRTDARTLANIRADADQTLWNFMLSVCGENLSISTLPNVIPSLAVAFPGVVAASKLSMELTPASAEAHNSVITSGGAISNADRPAPEATVDPVALVDVATTEEQAAMPTKITKANDVTVGQSFFVGENGDPVVASLKGEVSIYELLGMVSADQAYGVLPDPFEYKPSRFSQYRPDPYSEWSAANQGSGYLRKPSVMEAVPFGFYVGSSLVYNRASDDMRTKSAAPSLILGYADERAIRDFNSYQGIGVRLEGKLERLEFSGSSLAEGRVNYYSLTGELYKPLGGGLFVGLGASYSTAKDVLYQELGEAPYGDYDYSRSRVYMPIGFGFAGDDGKSGKFQVNVLLQENQKYKLSQFTRAVFSDATAKRRIGDGFGLEWSYSPSPGLEPFYRYWWLDKSDVYSYTINGDRVSSRDEREWEVEVGFRYFW